MLAVAIGLLTLNIAPRMGLLGAVLVAVLAWGLCINHLVARPHVASLPLMVIWVSTHVRARRDERAPPLFLALLMTLWANLHSAYFFGLALTMLFAAEAIFEAKAADAARSAAVKWGVFLCASIAAATITPHGLNGLLFPLHVVNMSSALGTVYEWEPSSLTNNAPLILWLLIILFFFLLNGIRLPICRLIIFSILLYMAFSHRRHTELLGLSAPLLLQDAIAARLRFASSAFVLRWVAFARPVVRAVVMGGAVSVAGICALLFCRDVTRGPDKYTPAAALTAVETGGVNGPVLNAQNFGGYLIFRGYAPFVDGRVDMYGDEFLSRYAALDQLPSILEQYQITWTIFEPANPRAVLMDHLPGWSRFYADSMAVIHVRSVSAPQ